MTTYTVPLGHGYISTHNFNNARDSIDERSDSTFYAV